MTVLRSFRQPRSMAGKQVPPARRMGRVRPSVTAVVACGLTLSPFASPADAAAAVTSTGPVVAVDWRGGYDGSGSADQTTATAVSSPATDDQSDGVVLIDTVLPYDNASGAGTGMVLTATGEILTNYHVVEGASRIMVTVAATGRTYAATLVGSDESDDVAVLQLTGASGLTTIDVDDDATAVGDAVTAVGNGGGAGVLTAAVGTITSLAGQVTTAAEGSVASQTLTEMIETTADVVAGDSGGPLLDAEGEVVGIDTAGSTGSVINVYAIPIERALDIVQQIRSGDETSTVQIGLTAFLGVELVPAYADRRYGSGDTTGGALVADVVGGETAQAAGLGSGDAITAVDGQAITSANDVAAALADHDPGDRVRLAWTDAAGADHSATVTLGASPVA